MLAKRVATIMPELTLEGALEVTKIHSVVGTLLNEAGSVDIKAEHLSEAIQYRSLDRDFFV